MPLASAWKRRGDIGDVLGRALGTLGRSWAMDGYRADDEAIVGTYPVLGGGRAVAQDGTDPGSVSENDAAIAVCDLNRRQYVNIAHPNLWSVATLQQAATPTGTPVLKSAPATDVSLYLTDLVITAIGTAGDIKLVENITSTPADVTKKLFIPTSAPLVVNFITPKKLTAHKNLGFQSNTLGRHSILANGYIAP